MSVSEREPMMTESAPWRHPMDMVIGDAEARLAAVKASYEAKLSARDAEWRAAVERVRGVQRNLPPDDRLDDVDILDALLAAMEAQ